MTIIKVRLVIKLLIFGLILVFIIPINPQQRQNNNSKGAISGILLDAQTKMPIEMANFILTSARDTSVAYGTVSDKAGKFKLSDIPFGLYNGRISIIGYKSRTRKNMSLNARVPEIRLDTVLLMPKGITFNEIQILGDKNRIVYDKDDKNKIIINPDKDWGNNALDLLENTPMVDIDIETGTISLLGKSGTVIYIDGNPAKFSGIMSNDDLKLLSVFDIDKFELIVNPSIEYGENTGGGVINIITKKIKTTKYNGNVSTKLNTNNLYEGTLGSGYNLSDVSFRSNYNNYYSKNNSDNNQTRQVVLADSISYLNQSGKSVNQSNGNAANFNISFNFDKSDLLSTNTMYRDGYIQNQQNNSNIYTNNSDLQIDGYQDISNTKTLHKFFTEGISYNKLFKGKGNSLGAAFLFSNNHMNLENDIIENRTSSLESLNNGSSINAHNTSGNSNNNVSWGANYKKQVNELINLFIGYNGNYTKLSMDDDYYYLDPALLIYNEDIKRKVTQEYNDLNQNISFGLSGSLYDIRYELGLKTNHKYTSTENKIAGNSYQNKFTNLDPKISLTKEVADGQNIGINYWRLTQYPFNKQLSPYVDYSDSTNIVAGNPELKPFSRYILSMSYNMAKGDFWGSTNIYYQNEGNAIETVTSVISPQVLETSYENLSSINTYGAGVYFRDKLAEWFEIEPSISGDISKYKSPGVSSESKSWNSNIRSRLSFNNFKFQMELNYMSPSSDAQQKSKASFYANAAAKLLLLDKQLSLTLRAVDLFNTKNNNSSRFGTGFNMINNIKQTTRIISLELAYYFQIKAADALEKEQNDTELPDDF
ncbi:MAG: TonB-dependent receptor [Ignavibacteriaceae bacterium]|nr:TonB-dependent receptor [Ignavibacteriaceae bacterium]